MFERRVGIVLFFLFAAGLALLGRAAQLQIAQAGHWRAVAGDAITRSLLTETIRGRILDAKDHVLAADVPCNDASVAYWFITDPPDEDRLYRDVARKLARKQTPGYADLSRQQQHELVLSHMPRARQQLDEMWNTLARTGGVTRQEIDAARLEVVAKVQLRRKQIIMARHRAAMDEHGQRDVSPWWRRWLLGEADAPPELAEFDEPIAEELQAHVVLPNLSSEAYNELRKMQDDLPGLVLTASTARHYPGGSAVAHVVGFLNAVGTEDLRNDPAIRDMRRAYLPRDLAGRSGVEKLAEQTLRGTRGLLNQDLQSQQERLAVPEVPGDDVQITIDMELQQAVRDAFEKVHFRWPAESDGRDKEVVIGPMPGAAVIIDVRTGAILSMVSYPDFDPNTYGQEVARLQDDEINRPLTNRALQDAIVPGSTIKPVIGLAAIAEGVLSPHETIECDGFFYYNGSRITNSFRCWTERMFEGLGLNGHQIPSGDVHPTHGLNPGFDPPPGHLTLADALQRSCNIFFQTIAERLGYERLNKWLIAFGLGTPTSIGLPEDRGLLLSDLPAATRQSEDQLRQYLWLAGTGQGNVEATPLQMANVAATLARGGVVIHPTLVVGETALAIKQKKDLRLDPKGLEMVRRGMKAVVQTPGGSGYGVNSSLPVEIAAKTGTAQAPVLTIPKLDSQGNPVLDEKGRPQREALKHSTRDYANPDAPWFRRVNPVTDGKPPRQAHGWFIGYAPADNPKVAFAVLVEYGGSGGVSAASVVTQMMDALVRLEYIEATRQHDDAAEVVQYKISR